MSIARGIATSIVGPIAGGREGDPTLTLHHDYTRSGYAVVGPSLTFTRASTATYFDSDGVMQVAAIDAMRKQSHVYEGGAWVNKGLLVEGQATNLLTYSGDMDGTNWSSFRTTLSAGDTSPDGSTAFLYGTASSTDANGSAVSIQTSAGNAAGTYTISVYAKAGASSPGLLLIRPSNNASFADRVEAWFNLSTGTKLTAQVGPSSTSFSAASSTITPVGNGVYRCSLTFTSTALLTLSCRFYVVDSDTSTTTTSGKTVQLWGSQLAVSSFATSYIPTTTSAVTRSADVATIGGTDFSGFYSSSGGTIVSDVNLIGGSTTPSFAEFGADTNNRITFARNASSAYILYVLDATAAQASVSGGTFAAGDQQKIAGAFVANDFALYANGASIGTPDVSGTIPTVSRLSVGSSYAASTTFNGHISSLKYYNVRKPNAFLESVTT